MTCQHCNNNEAEITVTFKYRQYEWELHLCTSCAEAIHQFTVRAMADYQQRVLAGGQSQALEEGGEPPRRQPDGQEVSAPQVLLSGALLEEIRRRRRINELEALLRDAILLENYEEAAKLRDDMKQLEKGVAIIDE